MTWPTQYKQVPTVTKSGTGEEPEKITLSVSLRKSRLLAMQLALNSTRRLLVKHRAIFHKRPKLIESIDAAIHQIDTALGD